MAGKGDLDFKVSAEPEKAIADLAKIVAKQEAVISKLKISNREAQKTKKSMSTMGTGLGKAAADVGRIATGFLTAQGAIAGARKLVGLFVAEIEDLKRKEAEAAQANITYAENFSKTISTWLGKGWIDEAAGAFGRMRKGIPALSYDQMTRMAGAYAGARPTATLAEGVRAVGMGAKLIGVETPENVLAFVGELEQIYPDKKLKDLFSIAVRLREMAGKRIEELEGGMKSVHKLLAYGITPERALGALMAAAEVEQAGRAVGTITSLLGVERKAVTPKVGAGPAYMRKKVTPLTEEQKIQNEIAGMTDAEYFEWMLQNPEKAKKIHKTTWASVAAIMKPKAMKAGMQLVISAQADNAFQRAIEDAGKQTLVSLVIAEKEAQAERQALQIGYRKGALIGAVRRQTKGLLEAVPGISKIERDMIEKSIEIRGRFGGDYGRVAIERLTTLREKFGEPTVQVRPMWGGPGAPYSPAFRREGFYGPGAPSIEIANVKYNVIIAETLSRLIDRITRLTEVYEKLEQSQNKLTNATEKNTEATQNQDVVIHGQGQVD